MTLASARIGKVYKILRIGGADKEKRRLLDMGFTPECKICPKFTAPFGNTMVIGLRDFRVALRIDAARLIEVEEA